MQATIERSGVVVVHDPEGWEGWSFDVRVRRDSSSHGAKAEAEVLTARAPEGQGITAEVWRRLPIGNVLAVARATFASVRLWAALQVATAAPENEPMQQRTARLYRLALSAKVPPVRLIAAAEGMANERSAQYRITLARKAGALGSARDEEVQAEPLHWVIEGRTVKGPTDEQLAGEWARVVEGQQ